ncbi:MAG: hypothetical protein AB8B86_10525 [Pseudomonadales bacterium]
MNPDSHPSLSAPILHLELGASALQARAFGELDCVRLEHFSSSDVNTLMKDRPALVITAPRVIDAELAMIAVRQSEQYWFLPVFLSLPGTAIAEALADGMPQNLDELVSKFDLIQLRLQELPETQLKNATPEFKLCAYLYSRPESLLSPLQSIHTTEVWTYPLANTFSSGEQTANHLISDLEQRNLLAQGKLIDRLKSCANCESAQLSFIDTCPDCSSIDIENSQFFHCFTCGHVAPESKFIRRDCLKCPQCETKFRHIGVDYDRPLEELSCKACSSAFIDGQVIARCLSCETTNDPEHLRSRRVYEYSLSSRAPYAIRQGELETPLELVDHSHFASPAYFNQMIDWLVSLARRYETDGFSVLKLSDTSPAAERSSTKTEQNEVFFRRIAELSRETDLLLRVGSQEVWILLPKTNAHDREIFVREVRTLAEKLRPGQGLESLRIFGLSVPEDFTKDSTGATVLEALERG